MKLRNFAHASGCALPRPPQQKKNLHVQPIALASPDKPGDNKKVSLMCVRIAKVALTDIITLGILRPSFSGILSTEMHGIPVCDSGTRKIACGESRRMGDQS